MGSRPLILLDTHALIWLDQDDSTLGKDARRLADESLRGGGLAVSTISYWEVAMLVARKRIAMDLPVARWRLDLLRWGLVEIVVDAQIAIMAAELDSLHGDPADRIIVASSLASEATLVTADERILDWQGGLDRHDARR
jgi:PIN domain nuclease of toxin-antitoxin system